MAYTARLSHGPEVAIEIVDSDFIYISELDDCLDFLEHIDGISVDPSLKEF